ncbi:NAD(P)-dependent oxidoreductase [Siccirubricoccus deserti]
MIAGATGFLHGARRGHIVICMSTIDPFALRRMGEALAGQGITLLDAPVSGGTTGAAAGTLSVIVGGPAEGFAACEDLFRAMGRNVFHVGALGNGLAMKLLNNMLLQVNTVAVAEALVLGTKAGLDPRQIEQVVSVSTGHSQAFARSAPRMIGRDFSASGTTDISFKDQELETGFAKALGVPILLANLTQQVYQMARAAGTGRKTAPPSSRCWSAWPASPWAASRRGHSAGRGPSRLRRRCDTSIGAGCIMQWRFRPHLPWSWSAGAGMMRHAAVSPA